MSELQKNLDKKNKQREYYLKNKEKISLRTKKYYAEHSDKLK